MFSSLDAESFSTIVANLFADVIAVKNNGFLSCQNIDISAEHIFVDPATCKISLVYLPIGKRLFCDMSAFENELRTSLIKFIQGMPSISSPKTMQLETDLSNDMLTIEGIYSKINGAKVVEKNVSSGHVSKFLPHNTSMKLVATNAPVPFEITITKDEFTLGRKQELVDGVISFNRMIGRSHCKIIRQQCFLRLPNIKSKNTMIHMSMLFL